MDQLHIIFPNITKLMLKSALTLSNGNVNTACLIITSKTNKTQSSLFQEYNKMLPIINSDILSNISQFLDIYDNVNLFYSNLSSKHIVSKLPNLKRQINDYKSITLILLGYFSNDDNPIINKQKKKVADSVLTIDHHFASNVIGESTLKEDSKFLKQITNHPYVPVDYQKFIYLLSISRYHFKGLIILNYQQLIEQIDKSSHTTSKAVPLIGRYSGMGYFYFISFINDDNNNVKDNFFISLLGGSNGYDCNSNYNNYNTIRRNDIKKYDFKSCLNLLFSSYYLHDNIISIPNNG